MAGRNVDRLRHSSRLDSRNFGTLWNGLARRRSIGRLFCLQQPGLPCRRLIETILFCGSQERPQRPLAGICQWRCCSRRRGRRDGRAGHLAIDAHIGRSNRRYVGDFVRDKEGLGAEVSRLRKTGVARHERGHDPDWFRCSNSRSCGGCRNRCSSLGSPCHLSGGNSGRFPWDGDRFRARGSGPGSVLLSDVRTGKRVARSPMWATDAAQKWTRMDQQRCRELSCNCLGSWCRAAPVVAG
jgi:hypothetical protein